jgi:hypothetical protein
MLLQHGPLREKANLGKPQEDQTENRLRILCRGQAGVGAELICRRPQAALQRLGAGVSF